MFSQKIIMMIISPDNDRPYQVNRVNIEPEILHESWSPSWKYNEV